MSYQYKDLSDKRCTHPGCNKRLKKKIVTTNPKADLCYFHYTYKKKLASFQKAQDKSGTINIATPFVSEPA